MILKNDKINQLLDVDALKESKAELKSFIIENSKEINPDYNRPAVIICPGGGYEFLSEREAEVVAQRFVASDISAFVLSYSVEKEKVYPIQLQELSAALTYVRRNAEKFKIDKDRIIVCGFSAGGHLAGNLGVSWSDNFLQETLEIKKGENKPNAMLLCYPVISGGKFAHRASFNNLLGYKASEEAYDKLSLEKCVNCNTPPTFIWHTFEDGAVPVENSLLFGNALRKEGVPFEMHIYTKGGHGLSLADKTTAKSTVDEQINPHVASWFKLAIEWLNYILE